MGENLPRNDRPGGGRERPPATAVGVLIGPRQRRGGHALRSETKRKSATCSIPRCPASPTASSPPMRRERSPSSIRSPGGSLDGLERKRSARGWTSYSPWSTKAPGRGSTTRRRRSFATGSSSRRRSTPAPFRDGTAIPIDESAAPIRARDGAIIGVVLVFRDLTARRRAEQARLKPGFVSNSPTTPSSARISTASSRPGTAPRRGSSAIPPLK